MENKCSHSREGEPRDGVREREWEHAVSVRDCECVCKSVCWGQRGEEMEQNKLGNERVDENVWRSSSLIWKYRFTCKKTHEPSFRL